MKRREIDAKLNDIVKFSEIEKFLDTPVKRYSSGMYVRLAFAVAAHLEPEILLVDEVLAVGDAAFQKKCLGKMGEVAKEGRTVFFVSHNMNAIEQLCNSCILIENGKLKNQSYDVRSIISSYLFLDSDRRGNPIWANDDKRDYNNPYFKPLKIYFMNAQNEIPQMPVSNNDDLWVVIEAYIEEVDPALTIGYAIYNEENLPVYYSYQTDIPEESWIKMEKGLNKIKSRIPKRLLNECTYRLELIGGLYCRQWLFEPGTTGPSIFLDIKGGLSDSPYWTSKRTGNIISGFKMGT